MGKKQISDAKRRRVFSQCGGRCFYCDRELHLDTDAVRTWTSDDRGAFDTYCQIDHIHPQVAGGTHAEENLVVACRRCNSSKGGQNLEEYRAFLMARNPHSKAAETLREALQLAESPYDTAVCLAIEWHAQQVPTIVFPGELRRSGQWPQKTLTGSEAQA